MVDEISRIQLVPQRRLKVIVSGAGVAGLATAAGLAERGHEVMLLEASPVPRPVGAGLLLQPPAMRLLDRLGAGDRIRASGSPIARLEARTRGGRMLLDVGYADIGRGINGVGVRRPLLWEALFEAAIARGVDLRPGCRVTGLTRDTDGASVTLAEGARHEGDLVVVASGTHTPLRAGLGRHVSRVYPWGCLWATVLLPRDWPDDVLLQRCQGSRQMAGVLPTGVDEEGRRTAAFYWSIRNDLVEACRDAPISAWQAEVERLWPAAAPLVAALRHGDLVHAAYRDVWADPPHGGHAIAVGDAAHGTSPQLGQGATQALRDAEALGEALEGEGSLEKRLMAYWAARRGRTAFYRTASRFLTPFFQTSSPGLGLLRDVASGPVGRIPIVRRQAALALAGLKTGLFGADEWSAPAEEVPTTGVPVLAIGDRPRASARQGE